jgi:hypothetical protein
MGCLTAVCFGGEEPLAVLLCAATPATGVGTGALGVSAGGILAAELDGVGVATGAVVATLGAAKKSVLNAQ